MQYRYYLNGTLLKAEPSGWDEKITTIKRDYDIKGIVRLQDGQLTFTGDGYKLLDTLQNQTSGFEQVAVLIEKSSDYGNNWREDFKGYIFLSQVEYLEHIKAAKVKLQDDSYYARINNNKSIQCFLSAGKTKNGIDIPPCPITLLQMFKVADGSFKTALPGFDHTQTYLALDVYKYLIAFMTDDAVEFRSSLFEPGGKRYKTHFTVGRAIRTYVDGCDDQTFYDSTAGLTFGVFQKEMDHENNLMFIIERGGAKPVFRLEEYDYFVQEDDVRATCEGVNELKRKTDINRLYSKLKIGSSVTKDLYDVLPGGFSQLSFPGDINFLGFKIEEYQLLTQGNQDKELDLTTNFIKDTNVIEDLLENNIEDYDEHFFVIDGWVSTWQARGTNWLYTDPPVFYNEAFQNKRVCQNYLKAIPASVVTFLGSSDNKFRAQKSADQYQFFTSPISFIDLDVDNVPPNFDTNSNYDASQSRFLVPKSGYYSFYLYIRTKGWLYNFADVGSLSAWVERWDNPMTSYISSSGSLDLWVTNGISEPIVQGTVSIIANAGDYIRLKTVARGGTDMYFDKRSYWECTLDVDGGDGITPQQTYDPADMNFLQHEFKHRLTTEQFDAIDADPRGLIEFSRHKEQKRRGWIEQLKYYHSKSEGEFLLDSSKSLNRK